MRWNFPPAFRFFSQVSSTRLFLCRIKIWSAGKEIGAVKKVFIININVNVKTYGMLVLYIDDQIRGPLALTLYINVNAFKRT